MIRRKTTKETPLASEQAISPSPISGVPPPVQYQFKPGQSGNPGGRPKILTEETVKWLSKTDEDGVTNAAKSVEAMGILSQTPALPHSVSAFKEIRAIAEPSEEGVGAAASVSALTRVFMELLLARREKMAKVIERQ